MTADLGPVDAPDPGEAIVRARTELQHARAALAAVTGGAPPHAVLADLAQGLAEELAAHFDELPMHEFIGRVARAPGIRGWLTPRRRVRHRVVLARYLVATPPQRAGVGYISCRAHVAIGALGADGVLRCGRQWVQIVLPLGTELSDSPLTWDDSRIRRVPSEPLTLTRWVGGPDPATVATPGQILEALTKIAGTVASAASRDLTLLRRLIEPRE